MIYTVTLNPSLDYVMKLSQLKKGSLNRTQSEHITIGGKGINVSAVLNELCIENIATGFSAGFTGIQLQSMLLDKGINQAFIVVRQGLTRINVKLKETDTDTIGHEKIFETEVNGSGPVITDFEICELKNSLERITKEDIMILSGSIPKGVSDYIYRELAEFATERNAKTVIDASGSLLINALAAKPFLIKPNKDELVDIFGVKIDSLEAVIKYGTELRNMGAQNVLVSLGGAGAVLIANNGRVYMAKAPQGQVISSVGAGDSMVAGFIAGYINNPDDYENALILGTAAGSATAFSIETALRESIMNLRSSVATETIF